MTDQAKSLFEQARKLPASERQELAELLLDTLEPDAGAEIAWGREAHRRWDEHVASGDSSSDAFEAIEDAKRRLKSGS